jgi:hypothetical protein
MRPSAVQGSQLHQTGGPDHARRTRLTVCSPQGRRVYQAIDRRSVNGEGWPGAQEAETGKAKDGSCLALGKGNGSLDSFTEEEVSGVLSG